MKLFILFVTGLLAVHANENPLLKEYSIANRKFSADIYRELKKTNSGNFLTCPLSVDIVLALVHAGAVGDTAKQLSDGLHLPESHEEIQKMFKELTPKLKGNPKYTLESANKLYVQNKYPLKDSFKSVAVDIFNADIDNIDFAQQEASAATMNKWVEDHTKNKIKDLISKDAISEDTRLVIINALYLEAPWIKQFLPHVTRKREFHVNKSKKIDVDTMEMTEQLNYFEDTDLKAKFLEMPYEGNDLSMIFVLPNEIEGLGELEDKIETVLEYPKFKRERVHVQIPKFTIESTIEFKPILENLGITKIFDDADLSGISGAKNLAVSKVIQKTFIEVEENGTKAAAATAVLTVGFSAAHVDFRKILEFDVDRPFLFYLKDNRIGSILFVGRAYEPTFKINGFN